jgi:fluoride exporter
MGVELSLPRRILAVFLGGFLGTLARYLLGLLVQRSLGNGWPYDILLINLLGAFLLALFSTLADAAILIGPTRRLFINVGFLGAYTTFSSLALGDVLLATHGQWLPAFLYLFFSVTGGILAVLLGSRCGRWWVKREKRALAGRIVTTKVLVAPGGSSEEEYAGSDPTLQKRQR